MKLITMNIPYSTVTVVQGEEKRVRVAWPNKRNPLMQNPKGRLGALCGVVDNRAQWRNRWEKARKAMLTSS